MSNFSRADWLVLSSIRDGRIKIENSDLHALHYANELPVPVRPLFKNFIYSRAVHKLLQFSQKVT